VPLNFANDLTTLGPVLAIFLGNGYPLTSIYPDMHLNFISAKPSSLVALELALGPEDGQPETAESRD
jgi:hypothetical protein